MKFLSLSLIAFLIICFTQSCFNKEKNLKPQDPKANFDFKIGKNGEVQFTNASTDAINFFWDFGNGETSTEENPKYIYKENGSYTVKLFAQNAEKKDSLKKTVVISDVLEPKAIFDFKIGKNGEVQFTNTSTDATNFSWDFGNGETSTEKSPSYIYKQNGSYAVKLFAQNAEKRDSLEKTVVISDIPVEAYVFVCEDQGTCYLLDAASGKKIWDYKFYPYIGSSPTFDKGQLFITTTGNSRETAGIISLNLEKGTKNWEFITYKSIISSPMVVNDKIYFISYDWIEDGILYCLDTKDGKVIWELSSKTFMDSSPTVYNGMVFIVTGTGLQIIDAERGTLIKNARIQNEVFSNGKFRKPQGFHLAHSSPAIHNGICYYTFNNVLFSYNLTSGERNISNLNYTGFSSPTIDSGLLYIHNDRKLLAINLSNFTEKWSFGDSDNIIDTSDSPFIADKTVYSVGSGNLYAIDAQSGSKKWHYNTSNFGGAINCYQSTVYVNSTKTLFALDTNTGKQKWSFPLNSIGLGRSSTPLIINNKGEVFHGTISGAKN
ncbi:outer membrane protein assembly factor BamB family protein [Emticicia soli]|uniref:PQQ-binding-like beta-propeller repeat protein n=1 Tax=Emticicia soli TaxID=2027878 RepID=A0ABW5J204_9BACT